MALVQSVGNFGTFFELGFEHIFGARDHLVFLLGLLLVCAGWRRLVVIMVTFTVAHSTTLVLSAALPTAPGFDAWVDSLIAATIAVVGIGNLILKKEPRHRVIEVFVFGLLHGFGFAAALRSEVPWAEGAGVVKPVLGFNLGVEAGQVLVAVIVFPLIFWARQHPKIGSYVVPVGSGLVAFFGAIWLVRATV